MTTRLKIGLIFLIKTIELNTMKKEEIIEGNKIIAEFVGFSNVSIDKSVFNSNDLLFNFENETSWFVADLKFHYRWDWLMLAVCKILKDKSVSGQYGTCHIYIGKDSGISTKDEENWYVNFYVSEDDQLNGLSLDSPIEAVWISVVDFIKHFIILNNGK